MNKALTYIPLSFLFITNLSAQVKVDNLESLWKVALLNNPTQKVYALKKEQINDDFKASQSYLYPQASVGFNGQDNLILSVTPVPGIIFNQPGKTIYLQFGKAYNYASGLTVNKDLFDWQTRLQSRIAQQNITLNAQQQDAYIQTLKTQIGQYYYALLVAKTSLTIADRDLSLADSIYQITKQKFTEGLTDASAVNLALINKNNVLQNRLQSGQLYNQSFANIKILAGIDPKESFSFTENTIEATAINDNASLGTDKTLVPYTTNINIAVLQKREQLAAYYPKLSGTGYFGFQQYRDRLEMGFAKNAWTDYQYIGVGLSWPIFTGFANSNKLKGLDAQKRIAEENYRAAKDQSSINDKLLLDNYISYGNMVANAKTSFDLYGSNLNLSIQKFREGLISVDNYLKTFQDYLNAENVYLNNLSSLLSVKATIAARQ